MSQVWRFFFWFNSVEILQITFVFSCLSIELVLSCLCAVRVRVQFFAPHSGRTTKIQLIWLGLWAVLCSAPLGCFALDFSFATLSSTHYGKSTTNKWSVDVCLRSCVQWNAKEYGTFLCNAQGSFFNIIVASQKGKYLYLVIWFTLGANITDMAQFVSIDIYMKLYVNSLGLNTTHLKTIFFVALNRRP